MLFDMSYMCGKMEVRTKEHCRREKKEREMETQAGKPEMRRCDRPDLVRTFPKVNAAGAEDFQGMLDNAGRS